MYRQNAVLNDFINFLKARGRFRSIEFVENTVQAIPRIPDLPSLIFYIEQSGAEQYYTLEITGNESAVMNREIREFFAGHANVLIDTKTKYFLTSGAGETFTIELTGIGPPFEKLDAEILDLISAQNYNTTGIQKTLVFGRAEAPLISRSPPAAMPSSRPSPGSNFEPQPTSPPIPSKASPKIQNKPSTPSYRPNQSSSESSMAIAAEIPHTEAHSLDTLEYDTDLDKGTDEKLEDRNIEETQLTDVEKDNDPDLFHPSLPDREYSDDVAPYLKQTTSLFRRDNWEEDLPSELEMEILERTYHRIKHRTKPEILASDMGMTVSEAEMYLRSLITKGLLRTQVGWFIIKKSHLPFFKKTFADIDAKRKKTKKSPRISRVGEGLTTEEISTIKAIKSRPNLKAQSNLLTRPTGLKQSVLKEVLRNLVDKGILRVSYGWYILKDKNILEHRRSAQFMEQKVPQRQFETPSGLKLTSEEQQVIQALLQRPNYKAQTNLLSPEVKLPKDQIKHALRSLVDKGIAQVKFGWYQLLNPSTFQVDGS
ncbi:MAG: hypothetical protein ACFFE8_08015 [Candidatus Heimdallarchaeota archaeon]